MTFFIISEILKKPNKAFEKISQNPKYFRLSMVLFSGACIMSFFSETSTIFFQESFGIREIPSIAFHVVSFGGIISSNFLIILFIFYIGRKLGGSTSFKQIFASMSFCFIPLIIGTSILASSTILYSFVIPSPDELSPTYAATFMLSPPMLSNLIIIPFFIWSAILYFKSIKITNNFTNIKTIITLVVAFLLMYLESMLYDLITSIPLMLMFH